MAPLIHFHNVRQDWRQFLDCVFVSPDLYFILKSHFYDIISIFRQFAS